MTTPTAIDPALPPAPPPPPLGTPTRSDRFFAWVAGLGVARSEGWIGGVCAGIAARLRIDPLIVRGVFVVASIVGLPLVFIYALAWALLPDAEGRIHARDLLHGRFMPPQLGILAVAVVGLIPAGLVGVMIGLPPFSLLSFGNGWFALTAIAFIIGLVLVGGLLFLIVRAARRTPGGSAPDLRTASADSAAPDESAFSPGSGTGEGVDGWGTDAGETADPAAPASDPALDTISASAAADGPGSQPILAAEATPSDIEAWRAQHAAWKEQDQAWRRSQQDAERAARDQARRERQALAAEFAIEAAERRRVQRASNPRASASLVFAVLGLALVAGATTALTADVAENVRPAIGLFVATLVTAVGMVVAGAFRRRSGFLAAMTVVLLVGGVAATAVPAALALRIGDYGISNAGASSYTADDPFTQIWGSVSVNLLDTGASRAPIHVVKRSGATSIWVQSGVELTLDATLGDAGASIALDDGWRALEDVLTPRHLSDGTTHYAGTLSGVAEPTTRQTVVLDQESGYVEIWLSETTMDGVTSGDD